MSASSRPLAHGTACDLRRTATHLDRIAVRMQGEGRGDDASRYATAAYELGRAVDRAERTPGARVEARLRAARQAASALLGEEHDAEAAPAAWELWWTSVDGQAAMIGGQYPTREDAIAALPAARSDMLDQCSTDDERAALDSGTWTVTPVDEHGESVGESEEVTP